MLRTLSLLFAVVCGSSLWGQELVPVILPGEINRVVSRTTAVQTTSAEQEQLPAAVASARPAICRVSVFGTGFRAYASGVLLDSGCVLTAEHTFREGGQPSITWHDQTTVGAQIVHRDPAYDLAMLAPSSVPSTVFGLPTAPRNMQAGDRLYTAGYGAVGDRLQWVRRDVIDHTGPDGGHADWLRVTGPSRQGDSGMPILTATAEVVGVVWGTTETNSVASNTGRTQLCQSCCPSGLCRPGLFSRRRIYSAPTTGPPVYRWEPKGGLIPQQVIPSPPTNQPPIVVQPPIPTTPPLPPTEPPPALDCVTSEQLAAAIAALQIKIDAIQAQPGAAGSPGTDGAPGLPGLPEIPGVPGKEGKDAIVDVQAVAAAVVEALKQDSAFVAACKGEKGDTGDAAQIDAAALATAVAEKLKSDPAFIVSCQGEPGGAATIDMAALTVEVQKRLQPITFNFLGKDKAVFSTQTVGLGGTVEVAPVIIIKQENGKLFWQIKALGDPLNLKLVPVR